MKALIKNNLKGLFILLPMLMLLFSAMQVRAQEEEEEKYYPKYRYDEFISVRGEKILENCFLKKSVIYGSKGGKIIFDLDKHIITFDNFKDEYDWTDTLVGYFEINFKHIEVMDMEIILKGDNEIILPTGNCKAIRLVADVHFKGPGTLTVIGGGVQCIRTMIVEDCDITINSKRFGMDVEYLELYNSDIDTTTTSADPYQSAFTLSYVIMENSTLRGVSKRAYWCAPWIGAEDMNQYFFDLDEVLTRKSGEIFVDDDGNTLYPVIFEYNFTRYFVFTKDVEAYNRDIPANIALAVNIASPKRINQRKAAEQVKEKIAAIGIVTANSGEKIEAARSAYENLEQNLRYKVKNIDVLEKAEKAYKEINQKEADKVSAMIAALGTSTSESGSKLEAVEKAYESLTADQRKLVSNYKDMEKARLKFQEAVEQKGQDDWLREQEAAIEGIRGMADGEFSKLQASGKVKAVGVKSAVSNKKGTLTLKWKKEKKCSGYEIVCSKKRSFKPKNTTTVLIKNKKQTSYTFHKLTRNKYYFVKIRSYQIVNRKKQYGKWSKVKKVKIK